MIVVESESAVKAWADEAFFVPGISIYFRKIFNYETRGPFSCS